MKSLADRISDERMSDNSHNYAQCKECVYRDRDNFQKYFCDKYPEDDGGKPDAFLLNKEKCEHRKVNSSNLAKAAEML